MLGNTLSDTVHCKFDTSQFPYAHLRHNQGDLGGDGLLDTSGSDRWATFMLDLEGDIKSEAGGGVRNEDGGSGSLGLLHGLCDILEDGQPKVLGASLLGVCASNNLCACNRVRPCPPQYQNNMVAGRIPYSIAC